jgi:hypothetical protein
MELKEFIEETILQIVEGVKSAQDKTKGTGTKINPDGIFLNIATEQNLRGERGEHVSVINYEIAITETKGKGGKAGIGVFFGNIGIGAEEKTDTKNMSVNSIKFSIPVILPKQGDV